MSDRVLQYENYTQLNSFVKVIDRIYPLKDGVTEVVFHTLDEFLYYERDTFREEASIRSVVFPEGLTEIPDGYFYRCPNLEKVVLPSTLIRIGDYAFYECASLKEVQLPAGLKEIGEFGFCGCTSLRTVYVPQQVTTLGDAAFARCTALTMLSFGYASSITSFGSHVAQYCGELASYYLPTQMEELKSGSFYECTKIHSVRIPKSVVRVHINAFFKSQLSEVVFTNGETLLQPGALHGIPENGAFLEVGGLRTPIPHIDYEEEISVQALIEQGESKK